MLHGPVCVNHLSARHAPVRSHDKRAADNSCAVSLVPAMMALHNHTLQLRFSACLGGPFLFYRRTLFSGQQVPLQKRRNSQLRGSVRTRTHARVP